MNRIKIGDKVDIFWADGDSAKNANLLYMARSLGELWEFKLENGKILYLNPLSLNFDCIASAEVVEDNESDEE